MLILGLLLVVLSGTLAGLLVAYNASGGPRYSVELFGNALATVGFAQAFVAGAAVAVVFCCGLSLIAAGARRQRQMRARFREAEQKVDAIIAERDRLAAELKRERAARLRVESLTQPAGGPLPQAVPKV